MREPDGTGQAAARPSPRRPPPSGDGSAGTTTRRRAPEDVAREIARGVGPGRAGKVEQALMEAAQAFDRDRLRDAWRTLRPLVELAPEVAAVRELAGLTLYRLGRWADAARHLEAFRTMTGSVEQHPVLADCYRGLGRFAKVEELWAELGAASPAAELVTEGRIVAAGALADQGRLREAIRLLDPVARRTRHRVEPHHLRLWYALADLYERAGDAPRARELFGRVAQADPGFADAAERLQTLD